MGLQRFSSFGSARRREVFLMLVATERRDHHRLISPKVFKTRWRQFRIPNRMLNIFVAEIGLQRPGIMPPVGQRVATRMGVACAGARRI